MENAHLIGLSRQIALQRELDVVANNIANINTTGFKADNTVFEEYLMPAPHAERSPAPDRRLSFVQDRVSWHDFSQGAIQQTGNPLDVAIDGDGVPGRADRRTASATPATARCRSTPRASSSPSTATRCSATTARSSSSTPTATSRSPRTARITVARRRQSRLRLARGKLRLVTFDQPAAAAEGRAIDLLAPDRRRADSRADATPHVIQGSIEKSNVNAVLEMTRMIERHPHLHRRSPD